MAASLDGRIDCAMTEVIGGDEYYETLEQLGAKTEINGKVTAQMHLPCLRLLRPKTIRLLGKPVGR